MARSIIRQGILGDYRGAYWRFLWEAFRQAPGHYGRVGSMAIHAEHFVRYTREHALPALRQAIDECRDELVAELVTGEATAAAAAL